MKNLPLAFFLLLGLASLGLAQWTEPVLFGVAHGNAIRGPWLSNDNLRLYAAFSGYIFVSDRVHPDSAWRPFHTVGNHVNGATRQESPCESPSGDTLYFVAYGREPGYGSYDIYYTIRTDTGWFGPIENAGPVINSERMEWTVGISRDGSKLIVCSNRIPGGDNNLYLSDKQEDGSWGPLVSCGPNVNLAIREEEHGSLSLSNDRLFFYRVGPRHGDVYCSSWQDSVWGPAEHLPEPVTTSGAEESDPCLAADGRTLYFISDRGHPYDRQLYLTTDTTVLGLSPRLDAVPLRVQPTLFCQVAEQTLRVTLIGTQQVGRYRLMLYDLLGRQVMSEDISLTGDAASLSGQVPLPALASGSYVAELHYRQEHFSTRFTVLR